MPISLINAQWVDGRENLRQAVSQELLPALRRHSYLVTLEERARLENGSCPHGGRDTAVTWGQANAYAKWVGGRLPTEAEWEKACRGTAGEATHGAMAHRPPSWPTSAVTWVTRRRWVRTRRVLVPTGALDMAGNVWEWTSSQYTPYPYVPNDGREDPTGSDPRTLRGGSFYYDDRDARCASRTQRHPRERRCWLAGSVPRLLTRWPLAASHSCARKGVYCSEVATSLSADRKVAQRLTLRTKGRRGK